MRGRRVGVAAAVALGVALIGPLPDPVGAVPTISVMPSDLVAPGDVVVISVDECTATTPPTIYLETQGDDAIVSLPLDPVDADTWQLTRTVGDADLTVVGVGGCPEGDLAGPTIDVENPVLFAVPIVGDAASGVSGTDCPPGATPEAVVVQDGVEQALTPSAPDHHGDWRAGFDVPLAPGPARVRARCGGVTYAVLDVVAEGSPPTTTSTTTSSSTPTTGPPPGPAAVPATPVATAARFTG